MLFKIPCSSFLPFVFLLNMYHFALLFAYSSFLRVRAMRADRRPAGVMTVPVFCSKGVPDDRVLTGVVGAGDDGTAVLLLVLLPVELVSERAESLENPKTAKNPSSPIYENKEAKETPVRSSYWETNA
jgi:hypothetical protein